jgi:threonine dehydratase
MKAVIERAQERIASITRCTPCQRSTELSREVGADVFLKLENRQHSGSLKLRGVANKILSLAADDFILLTEEEIAGAIRFVHEYEDMVIEGAAALSVATVLKRRECFAGQRVVLVITGSRIDEEVLRRITA